MYYSIDLNRFRRFIVIGCCLFISFGLAAGPQRSEADLLRDKSSKPHEIIEFLGIQPGESILDLFGGGGYYSELISTIVGDKGHVTLHNNQAYLPFAGKELSARFDSKRLTKVIRLVSEANALGLGQERFDAVIFVLGYHDLFVEDKGWNVKADQVIPQVYKALKPGGRFLIIDHSAKKRSGASAAQKLHRIESDFVKQDMISRGFKFIKSLGILKNSSDPLDINVFDPKIRRKTDRFVYLFSKEKGL